MAAATTAKQATDAMVDFEKPAGYNRYHPELADNYRGRLAATDTLANDPEFAVGSTHNVNITLTDPAGKKTLIKLPALGAPKAAGAAKAAIVPITTPATP
jgi:hypothetical protein